MTRTTRPTNCIECGLPFGKGEGKVVRESSYGLDYTGVNEDVCTDCYDYWGQENTHSDNGHDAIITFIRRGDDLEDWMITELEMMVGCRVCKGDTPGSRPARIKSLLDNKTWHSHAGHGHPLTQAGRAACRRAARKAAG